MATGRAAAGAHRPEISSDDLALLVFAAGLPVSAELVIVALRRRLASLCDEVNKFTAAAVKAQTPIPDGMSWSPTLDTAEAVAQQLLSSRSDLVRNIRRRLSVAGQPAADPDVMTVLISLARTLLGDPPPADDSFALEGRSTGSGPTVSSNECCPTYPAFWKKTDRQGWRMRSLSTRVRQRRQFLRI